MQPNAVSRMLGLLGDEWTLLVAQQAMLGATRFTEFMTRLPILLTALDWAQRWYTTAEGPAVLLTHTSCGTEFTAVLTCDQCGEPLRVSDIGVDQPAGWSAIEPEPQIVARSRPFDVEK